MLDDVLHNQCVQDTDVDQVMAEGDQVIALAEGDQVIALADTIEMDLLETNTKKEEALVHHTEDKVVTLRRSGSLTLKEKD